MSEKLTVKNVVNINKSTLSSKENWSTLKYLDTGNITENQIDTLQIFQKGEKLPSRAKRKVEKGTIIYSTVRPNQKHFGYFDTYSNDLVVSTGFATLDVIDPRVNSKYLYYLLTQNSVISQLQSIGENSTSSYPSIRPEDIGNLSFMFPDIDIQNKIANILSAIDDKIQINNQINQELEAMAKTLYDYWFVQFDFPDQNGKPYKSSGGKMVYNPELKREIPEGWGVEKLSHFLIIKNGKDHKHLQDGKFAVYGSGGIMRTVTDYLYSGESILFPRKGTLNNVMYVNEKFWTVDTMFYSEVNKNNSALYVFYSVKDIDFNKLNTGTGVPSMTSSILYDLNIIVPEENILEKFNTVVKRNYETIKLNNIQNQELTQLRDWLLPMLMNGQVKVE